MANFLFSSYQTPFFDFIFSSSFGISKIQSIVLSAFVAVNFSDTIAPTTGIDAVGDPVLKVHFVDTNDQKTITEAYYTEGTWTTRELANQ